VYSNHAIAGFTNSFTNINGLATAKDEQIWHRGAMWNYDSRVHSRYHNPNLPPLLDLPTTNETKIISWWTED